VPNLPLAFIPENSNCLIENVPPLAFSVRDRKYPPGELIDASFCKIHAIAVEAVSGPMKRIAS
jgi:hypothetical protein